jgi:hypothetical protein
VAYLNNFKSDHLAGLQMDTGVSFHKSTAAGILRPGIHFIYSQLD